MLTYNRIKKITSPVEFSMLMKSKKTYQFVIEDNDGKFLMFLNSTSRVKDAYSATAISIEDQRDDMSFGHPDTVNPQDLSEVCYDKRNANFTQIFKGFMKKELGANVWLVTDFQAIKTT